MLGPNVGCLLAGGGGSVELAHLAGSPTPWVSPGYSLCHSLTLYSNLWKCEKAVYISRWRGEARWRLQAMNTSMRGAKMQGLV